MGLLMTSYLISPPLVASSIYSHYSFALHCPPQPRSSSVSLPPPLVVQPAKLSKRISTIVHAFLLYSYALPTSVGFISLGSSRAHVGWSNDMLRTMSIMHY